MNILLVADTRTDGAFSSVEPKRAVKALRKTTNKEALIRMGSENARDKVSGVAEVDEGSRPARDGGEHGQITDVDSGTVGVDNSATTEDGGIAIAGGKLAGNHDDFEGELREGPHAVPGADKRHHPAHAMNKGETKHLGT